MSSRTKVWSLILVVCAVLTIWQIPNLKTSWREYKTIRLIAQMKDSPQAFSQLTDLTSAEEDPEAAGIVNYFILGNHFLYEHDINELATLISAHPQNELFLFVLCNELLKTDSLDSKAALIIADKLINNRL